MAYFYTIPAACILYSVQRFRIPNHLPHFTSNARAMKYTSISRSMNEPKLLLKHCRHLFRLQRLIFFHFLLNGKITFSFHSGQLQATYKLWGHVKFIFRIKLTVLCTVYNVQLLINSKLVFHSEHSCGLLGKKNTTTQFQALWLR